MLKTYWQLSNRLLEEEQYGNYGTGNSFMHSHAHHHHRYSHHQYPINYSRSNGGDSNNFPDLESGNFVAFDKPEKIRTPQPKKSVKNLFNDQDEIILISKSEASKLTEISIGNNNRNSILSSTASSAFSNDDYKSLQISPLDFSRNIY